MTTKGEWKVKYLPITKQPTVYAGDELIAAGMTEANAHLIAASPMMYEALEAILLNRDVGEYESQKRGLPRMVEVNNMGRQALSKAEGK